MGVAAVAADYVVADYVVAAHSVRTAATENDVAVDADDPDSFESCTVVERCKPLF